MFCVVYSHNTIPYDHSVSRQADDPFNKLLAGVLAEIRELRFGKDDNITAVWDVGMVGDARPCPWELPYDEPVVVI
jgi:hypothetical protein